MEKVFDSRMIPTAFKQAKSYSDIHLLHRQRVSNFMKCFTPAELKTLLSRPWWTTGELGYCLEYGTSTKVSDRKQVQQCNAWAKTFQGLIVSTPINLTRSLLKM